MVMMGCRLENLRYLIEALNQTTTPLVLFKNNHFEPFTAYDDIGIYVLIPKLVKYFSLTLPTAINLFFYGFILLSLCSAFLGFLLLYKDTLSRLVAILGLILLTAFIIKTRISDVYLCYAASCLSVIPLFLYFIDKKLPSKFFEPFLIYAGFLIGIFHYVRSWSSLAVLFFIIILIAAQQIKLSRKAHLYAALIGGLIVPVGFFNYQIKLYNAFALHHFPEAQYLKIGHPFWHTAYIGLGYLKFDNDEICYLDECAQEKVSQINPSITLKETDLYENILKHELFDLFCKKKLFILSTIFAKIGVLLLYLLLFMNSGLICLFLWPHHTSFTIGYVGMLCINSIFPIMAIPSFEYSLGFITLSTLLGILSIGNAMPYLKFFFKNKILQNKYI